jgi:molybdate transport system substrate-binding protein
MRSIFKAILRRTIGAQSVGEADAGIVYRSDAMAAREKVRGVEVPPDVDVTAEYPIAVLKAAPHSDLARRFVELVRSPAGASALREAGFVQYAVRWS